MRKILQHFIAHKQTRAGTGNFSFGPITSRTQIEAAAGEYVSCANKEETTWQENT